MGIQASPTNLDNKVQILRVSNTISNDNWSNDRHVDIPYFTNKETAHYAYIKNFSRLLSSQVYKSKHKSYPCKRCRNIFRSQQRLNEHLKCCSYHKAAVVEMPEPGEKVVFNETNKCIKHPFVIYADFESILEKTDDIKKYQKHIPCGFCCYIKSSAGSKYDKLELYRGPDAADEFVKRIEDDCIKLTKIMSRTNKPLNLSLNEEKEL